MFAFTICFLNIFFKAAIVFRVLLNWQLAFTLLCSLIFVAGFCYDCVKCCAIGWVSIFPMWKSSGRAFAAATVRCRGRGYIAFQSCKFRRKALRVTPRGKHWLTVYRAPQVQIKRACQKVWYLVQKNEDFSESMNSFDSGSIFPSSLGHDLSRNRSVVSVYAF